MFVGCTVRRFHRGFAVLPAVLTVCIASQAGVLRFDTGDFDTSSAPHITEKMLRDNVASSGEAAVFVQFAGPVQPEWIDACQKAGVNLHVYIPDFGYVVTAKSDAALRLTQIAGVGWVGSVPAAFKVEPALASLAKSFGASQEMTMPLVVLSVLPDTAKLLEGQGYRLLRARRTQMGWYDIRALLPISKAFAVADMPGVFRVERQPEYQLHGERGAQTAAGNYPSGGTAPTGPGYAAWLANNGLTGGSGLIVQVQDDGIDQGDSSGNPGTAHPDVLGRIAGIFDATSDPLGDSGGGHGQINAAIIIGNAAVGTTDQQGYKLGQGMAPLARVYGTKIFNNSGLFDAGPNTFTGMARNAQDAGATYSNNSWGASVAGAYTADSAEFDALTRDADPTEPGNQPMIYFFSAGNDGPFAGSVAAPGTAKNVITVGAGENSDADGTDGCGVSPSGANNIRDIILFSSRGPADDGRLLPTLFSVGTHVQGAASTSPNYSGIGVCDRYWPVGQTNYARSSGTSHSCPMACGAGMIVGEFFATQLSLNAHPANPSPALMKAVLVAAATDMAGGSNGNGGTLGPVPNNDQGWGSVNLSNLVNMEEFLFSLDQAHLFTGSGQVFEAPINPMDASQPTKIVLAWTDKAGTPGGAINLVNDLDLEVVDGATTYRGNVFTNGFSAPGGAADRRNNLECVFLANPTGPLTARVRAFNIVSDGVPGVGGSLDQDFALFVWNGLNQSSAGAISLAPEFVRCSDTLTVTVNDADLQGEGTVNVTLRVTTGDDEALTLAEIAPNSGVFEADINTNTGAVSDNNGSLQVSNGATITGSYVDADDGTGTPITVNDTTTVDCVAPTITNVQVANVNGFSARIAYVTNEPATSNVDYGTSCVTLSQTRPGGENVTQHAARLTGLAPLTTYYFRVAARDAAGNSATNNNGGACFSFTTTERADYFTEEFAPIGNDVANQTLLFTPNGSVDFYEVCRSTTTSFPTDPSSGAVLPLSDDDFETVTLTGGQTVKLYGTSYVQFHVGSNGFVTFSSGDVEYLEDLDRHFAQPRISGLFDDLVPAPATPVRFQQFSDRAVVTWVGVPEFGASGPTGSNRFQIEMFFDGRIRLTHLSLTAPDGIVGLSGGEGLPGDFLESDLSGYGGCGATLTISGTITSSGSGLSGVVLNGLPGPPVTNASGQYSATVPQGLSGTVTPERTGFAFTPASRTYTNVSSNLTGQDYTAAQAQVSVTPSNRNVGSGSGTTTFAVSNTGAGNMNWTASVVSGGDWLSITSGGSGTNSGTITCSFAVNSTGGPRVGTVRVTADGASGSPADVTVTQSGDPELSVTPSSRSIGAGGGSTTFDVANAGGGTMNWTAGVISGSSWLTITSGNSGTNSGTITCQAAANSGAARRTGTIRVTAAGAAGSPRDVTVMQSGRGILAVSPVNRDVGSGPGDTTFEVNNAGSGTMSWTASVVSGGPWLSITSGSSGTNSGTITCAFLANTDAVQRLATIEVVAGGVTGSPAQVTVTQEGRSRLAVVPIERVVSAAGGSTTFDVSNTGQGALNWNAAVTSGNDWLSITSGSSGTNAGTITAAFLQNSAGVERMGTIQVTAEGALDSPVNLAVTQAMPGLLQVTPSHRDAGPHAGFITFQVANAGGQGMMWQADVLPGAPWLAITAGASGTDAGVIQASFGANNTGATRQGTIRISSGAASNGPVEVTVNQISSSITLLEPNGGERWKRDRRETIRWVSSGAVGSEVAIELWRNGAFVRTIKARTPNDGRHRWRVPPDLAAGRGYSIKIYSKTIPAIADMSDQKFRIK